MQTLYTIEDKESGGVKTLLHVSSYTNFGLVVIIYISDEYGTFKRKVRRTFLNTVEYLYHKNLRKKITQKGGIVHKRVSDTPLKKSISSKPVLKRDKFGRFCK